MKRSKQLSILVLASLCYAGCAKEVKVSEDSIYSRHLQKHMALTIFTTPVPEDKSTYNLLLLNDGQDVVALRVQQTLDSLYKKNLL